MKRTLLTSALLLGFVTPLAAAPHQTDPPTDSLATIGAETHLDVLAAADGLLDWTEETLVAPPTIVAVVDEGARDDLNPANLALTPTGGAPMIVAGLEGMGASDQIVKIDMASLAMEGGPQATWVTAAA